MTILDSTRRSAKPHVLLDLRGELARHPATVAGDGRDGRLAGHDDVDGGSVPAERADGGAVAPRPQKPPD